MYQSPRSYQKALSARHSDADSVDVTYLSGARQKGENWVGAADGLTDARIGAVEQTDDPANRFRSNQTIAPAG
jgi:hypothetical protein